MFDQMGQWLDLLWLPIPFLILPKHQWLEAFIVMICSSVMMRFQVELVEELGYKNGLTGYLPFDPYNKALITYSIIIALYIILMLILNKYNWRAHIVLSFSIFFNAFIISSIVLAI